MSYPKSFYDELEHIAREAYKLDRKRAIRETAELLLCFGLFMAAIWIAGALGMAW